MKVLIVIDNLIQYKRIKSVIEKQSRNNIYFDFRHSIVRSAIWDHEDFLDKSNSSIDVKKDIAFIIKNYQLVISVHCFQFFPKDLVVNVRCINIHPGYNPINRGWYPQVFSLIYNLPIGATIHEMDEQLDHGLIIAREYVNKYTWDTSLSLYERVLEKEIELFEKNLDLILSKSYQTILPEGEGNLFSKSDFYKLFELDMDKKGTFGDFYDHLRALSHGDYKNAHFIDRKTGKKIFLKLEISHE